MKGRKVGLKLFAVLVGLGMAMLIGCGGSKAPVKSETVSSVGASSGYGTVTLSVQWSKVRGRVIPEATERIVARLKRSGVTLFEKVIERGQTQVVFEKVPVGEWVLEAEALGSGEEVVHVKGVVKANDQPVAGAQVTLTAYFPDTGDQKTYTATTDDQGRFDFGLLKWFHGELQVVASGYPEWRDWVGAWEFMRPEGLVIDLTGESRKRQLVGGVTLASGATSFTLGANENKQVEVVLASRLSDLYVTPREVRLSVYGEVDVSVQGLIEQAAEWDQNLVRLYLVPLSGDKVRWQIADSSVASLSSQTGLSVTVRGLKEGQTTLTVTDTESGKSKQVVVIVSMFTAKSITQMLRDFGAATKSTFESEPRNIHDTLVRLDFPIRVIGDSLEGLPPARYREGSNLSLERVGDAPDRKTWIVESSDGLILTVISENATDVFDPSRVGRVSFSVQSPSSSFTCEGTLNPLSQGGIEGNAQIKDVGLSASLRGSFAANPLSIQGELQYRSNTLTFSGSVSLALENEEVLGFGSETEPVSLTQVPKGTFSLQGNWAPQIGRPAGIDLQMTSNPQGNAPHVTIKLTLNYGGQGLSGTITGTLDIQNNQSYGFKSGNLDMSHSPSNFKVRVSAEKGKATSGQIVTAQGEKVADIGEARNLGLPDLGSALIVKYTDGTFETLESVLPRSRLSKK